MRLFNDFMLVSPQAKKIQSMEGEMIQLKTLGEMINDTNKRIGRMQKEFDIQGVIYSVKGLEEYLKK